jgi:hypothetical protein
METHMNSTQPTSSSASEKMRPEPDAMAGEGRLRGMKVSDIYSRLLAPAVNGVGPVMETLVVMLIALAIGRVFVPADPLFLDAGFPYAWVLPIVIALRYGTLLGVFSCMLMAAGWFFFYDVAFLRSVIGAEHHLFPRPFFLGGFLLIFVVGQFGDIWAGRMARAYSVNAYLSDRLSALTKNHFLLKVSHERLENDLLTKPTTLRGALLELRQVTTRLVVEADDPLPGAAQLLQFAAHACQLETAALYAFRDGRLMQTPAAQVGIPFELATDDPLIATCLDKKVLTHLQTSSIRNLRPSDYVVCVPLLSGAENIIGVLVIKHMPFLSLTQENLQFLLVLAGYYADGARPLQAASLILDDIANCPQDFALDYVRLARLEEEAGVASTVVALTFGPGDLQETLCSHVRRGIRALDVSWRIKSGDNLILLVLMPLTDDDALTGYLLRAERSVQEHFGLDFGRAHISFQSIQVGSRAEGGALKRLLNRVHVDA